MSPGVTNGYMMVLNIVRQLRFKLVPLNEIIIVAVLVWVTCTLKIKNQSLTLIGRIVSCGKTRAGERKLKIIRFVAEQF